MKDSTSSLTSIRTKVASNLNNNSISSLTPLVRTAKFGNSTSQQPNNNTPHNNSNNSDDEFELPLGNLIIDLDADIEKSNERLSSENESQFTATPTPSNSINNTIGNSINSTQTTSTSKSSPTSTATKLSLFEPTVNKTMSTNSKTIRDVNNGQPAQQINQTTTNTTTQSNQSNSGTSKLNSGPASTSNQLQSTAASDNSLKLKFKRKSIGGKSSESKLEIVQSSSSTSSTPNYKTDKNGLSSTPNDVEKIKHHSSKNKNSSHKEKKEKKERKEKDKNSNLANSMTTKNGSDSLNSSSTTVDLKEHHHQRPSVDFTKKTHNHTAEFNPLKKDNSALDSPSIESPPFKKSKNEDNKNTHHHHHHHSSSSLNGTTLTTAINNSSNNKTKPETRSVSTATNVSTMTEPECLGFCEPGSAICLEGITWVEAEGVLVVNVTWRGKSYVGTLLDCTRHDWGPPHPRLCDSPTSDLESKGLKSGRGKRARSSISEQDSRLFQSKLRNGKGRRNNNFTVPASPLKVDQQNKRNVRNNGGKQQQEAVVDTKSASSQSNRNTPTPTLLDSSSAVGSPNSSKQPNSPVFIECPEPNCCKKYKHINGLKYHQTHAHSSNKDELDETGKEIITDPEEEMEVDSIVETSSLNKSSVNEKSSTDADNSPSADKKPSTNCDKLSKNSDKDENVQSPAYSDISDVNENSNGNELSDSPTKNNSSSAADNHKVDKKEDDSTAKNKELKKELNSLNSNCDQTTSSRESESTIKSETTSIPLVNSNSNKEDNHQTTIDKEENQPNKSISNNNNALNMPNNLPTNLNSHLNSSNLPPPPPQLNPAAMNPNQFQFPFNMLPPQSHYPLPIDSSFQAYFMQQQQDRMLMDEQKHLNELKMNSIAQQHKTSLSPQLMNSHQQPPQQQMNSQFNQPNQQQPPPPQNKPSSPYDFIQHHEKQQQEMLKLTNRNAEDRFMNKQNSLGNLSSPKQQSAPPSSTSVQQLFNPHQNTPTSSLSNSMIKEEQQPQRTTPKQPKDEGIKATMETQGPPPAPTNSFYSMSPFLAPQSQFGPLGPQGLPFDPNSSLFRAQQAAFNPNLALMNNLRFGNPNPLGPPQLPLEMRSQLPGQDMNSKLMNSGGLVNANGNNKKAFEMLQQASHQYNLKEMQDKIGLISPGSANKNGLPGPPMSLSNNTRQSHPGMPQPLQIPDPFGALIKHASGFPK